MGQPALRVGAVPDAAHVATLKGRTMRNIDQHTITAVSYIARLFDQILNESE